MGANADVIAVGRFKKSIADDLDYPKDWYEDVAEGTRIITTAISKMVTNEQSCELARLLGTSLTIFNTHFIESEEVNWYEMKHFFVEIGKDEECDKLKRLLTNGFKLIFRPNT